MGLPLLQLFVSLYNSRTGPSSPSTNITATIVSNLHTATTAQSTPSPLIEAMSAVISSCISSSVEGITECASTMASTGTIAASASEPVATIASQMVASMADTVPAVVKVVEDTSGSLEFLPLMLTSVYCAVGLLWAFGRLSWIYLFRTSK